MPNPYCPIIKDINTAASFIASGRVVAFPTGTSYGLAADATQGYALQRLRILKGRPQEQSFTVMLSPSLWPKFLSLTPVETKFLARVGQQPLTLLVKPRPALAHLAQNERIGLRLIDHPLMGQLCQITQLPLTSTSANRTGETPCFTPDCIQTTFPGLLPDNQLNETYPQGASGTTYNLSLAAIIDGGTLPTSDPTTIIMLQDTQDFTIIRPGVLSETAIKQLIT